MLRGDCPETYYNIGRAMHQLALFPQAIFYYNKVLSMDAPIVKSPPPVATQTAMSGITTAVTMTREEAEALNDSPLASVYDLKPMAAHNLALIYKAANNPTMAQAVLRQHCAV